MKSDTLAVFDFTNDADAAIWDSVDDVVMGGVSRSAFRLVGGGIGVFEGVLSLEHGGGFASVRSQPAQFDLSAYDGLEIRVRGDGKRYRLRLRTDAYPDGVAYQVGFETQADTWQSERFLFQHFRPTFRGRTVPDAPPLDASHIASFGWMIADKQAGAFRLEIDSVRAYVDGVL